MYVHIGNIIVTHPRIPPPLQMAGEKTKRRYIWSRKSPHTLAHHMHVYVNTSIVDVSTYDQPN